MSQGQAITQAVVPPRRRGFLPLLLILAACAVAGGVAVGMQLYGQNVAVRAERHSAAMATLLKQGRLEDAGRLWKWLEANDLPATQSPPLRRLKQELDSATAGEPARREAFASALAKAREAGRGSADWQTIALARANARTADERLEVARLEAGVSEQATLADEAAEAEFASRLERFQKQAAAAMAAQPAGDLPACASQLAALAKELSELSSVEGVSPRSKAPLAAMAGELHAKRMQVRLACLEAELASPSTVYPDLADYASSPAVLCRTLEAFLKRHPRAAQAESFRRSLGMEKAWQTAQDAIAMARPWLKQWQPPTAREAARRSVALDIYLRQNGDGPLAAGLREYATYLAWQGGDGAAEAGAAPGPSAEIASLCGEGGGTAVLIRPQGRWRLIGASDVVGGGREIWTIADGRLRKVGAVVKGQLQLAEPDGAWAGEGTMVFLGQGRSD